MKDERHRPAAVVEPLGRRSLSADAKIIGQVLRRLREGERLPQTEVARRGGPDSRTISHWETGRKVPSLRLLFRYLAALRLDLHDLQHAFDLVAAQPDRLRSCLRQIEGRLNVLERSLEPRKPTAADHASHRPTPQQNSDSSTQ